MPLNVLIVPGYHGSGNAHWQTWLERQIHTAKRVSGIHWDQPIVHDWTKAIIDELEASSHKTVIIAHSFGCLASAMAITSRPDHVAGAILVAPADPQRFGLFGARKGHLANHPSIAEQLPNGSLNVPGLVIGSRNDRWMKLQHAYAWSQRWNLEFHDAGEAGHINVDSGFGPWPLIKLFTESLCDLLQDKSGQLTREVGTRAAAVHKLNRFLPRSTVTFHQQHFLYT